MPGELNVVDEKGQNSVLDHRILCGYLCEEERILSRNRKKKNTFSSTSENDHRILCVSNGSQGPLFENEKQEELLKRKHFEWKK